jgi:urocanate hydratase
MALNPNPLAAFDVSLQAERFFAALMQPAATGPDSEPSLGGKLLYAGNLDAEGRALVVAANIAGTASLTATADQSAQKQAIRDGVADFLVTSLDEALRILKNEIRKRETVAVCVAAAPGAIEREMLERGVLPDLLRPGAAKQYAMFLSQGAQQIQLSSLEENQTLLTWSVASAPAQWLPKLDAIALACLKPEDAAARRWLRLAPRYLGRLAENQRLLRTNKESTQKFLEQLRDQINQGKIKVPVEIRLTNLTQTEQHQFSPPAR